MVNFDQERLAALRRSRGWSHAELAELLNARSRAGAAQMTEHSIAGYERNLRPGLDLFLEFAALFEVDPFELMSVTAETATVWDLVVRAGLTMQEFSSGVGLSFSKWRVIEVGRQQPSPQVAARAADLLKVRSAEFMDAWQRGVDAREARRTPADRWPVRTF